MVIWAWAAFIVFVLGMLALDLGVLNRGSKVIRTRDALKFSLLCGLLAVAFSVFIYFAYERDWLDLRSSSSERLNGWTAAMQFLAGWVIEQSLSLDNIFVIAVIFTFFGVPMQFQHRTLFWGIIGALVMRLGMILIGATLIAKFSWIMYVFGVLLLYTAYKMLRSGDEKVHPDRNPLVRIARRFYPVTSEFYEERFFVRMSTDPAAGASAALCRERLAITPLFLTLLAIESTDVLFAIDSIPAIFAITKDSFIVFTSNVFAILNLRSLYFVLADLLDRFRLLKYSLVVILAYVGVKMLLEHHFGIEIPMYVTLAVLVVSLGVGVIVSVRITRTAGSSSDEPGSTESSK
ncbi:MAG: TerC family protein [Planctomycetes bacterium]|nr:TerC family protein [Planctomycetota bacterium]